MCRYAFELHDLVGPSRATISAVAERAGVQRHTVYRHLPDMVSLIRACTEHGMRTTVPPDPEPWLEIRDPMARLRTGLPEAYAYYRRNERLFTNLLRDAQVMPELVGGAEASFRHWGRIREVLSSGWRARGRRRELLLAAVGHVVEFSTWHSLARGEGLSDDEAVEVMVRLVRCLS